MIKVRHSEPADYEAIRDTMAQPRALANTLQLPLPSAEMWKKRVAEISPGVHILVAELDGKVVGNLGLHPAGKSQRRKHAYTVGMSVHDDHTRKGVASALLAAAIDIAENWLQAQRIELEVFVDNAPAIALYRKFGFEIEGTHKRHSFRNGVFVDSHTMARIKPQESA